MLSSIHPLGERVRHNRWWLTVSAFALGSVVGGLAAGGLAGGLGVPLRGLPDTAVVVVALVAVAIAVLADAAPRQIQLPDWHRQVNEDWMERYRGWVYGAGFGLQLGAGFLTIVTTGAVHLTFVLALLTRSPLRGAVVGATFGLVRGISPLVAARTRDVDSLRRLHHRLDRARPIARMAALVGMVGVGLGTAMSLITRTGA